MLFPFLKLISKQSVTIKGQTSTEGADKAVRIIATGLALSLVIISLSVLLLTVT
ncbi:hypothetical protein TUM4433_28400 [Shewanella schlegeliana]|nr:hypothetical protein TUM4433_28400 [Shewanella schlegeliana]